MSNPPWETRRMTPEERKRQRYEEQKYEPGYCDECGEKRAPPRMDLCPYCHPNTKHTEDEDK